MMDDMENINTTDGTTQPPSDSSSALPIPETFTPETLKAVPHLNLLSYMTLVEPLAKEIEASTGIYYLVPIVQSAHESALGNSGLARNHCNLFGIVATDIWKKNGGAIALMPTFEFINGHRTDMDREFRAYPSWKESFQDWAHLITTLSIYKKAYELMKDKATVPAGITEMGKVYATDLAYSKSLIQIYSSLL